jgi:hypothetical protein
MEEERIRILSAEEAVPDDLGSRHRKLHVAKKGNFAVRPLLTDQKG